MDKYLQYYLCIRSFVIFDFFCFVMINWCSQYFSRGESLSYVCVTVLRLLIDLFCLRGLLVLWASGFCLIFCWLFFFRMIFLFSIFGQKGFKHIHQNQLKTDSWLSCYYLCWQQVSFKMHTFALFYTLDVMF